MLRRLTCVLIVSVAALVLAPAAALACGGLVAPGHAEALQRATTLSAWHDGYEHYVTGFQFVGSAERFGYIIPLPGVPSKIEKGGEWTLERLLREVNPVREFAADAAGVAAPAPKVTVIQRVTVDALDIVVVKGGGRDVAAWAGQNGFALTPDTPTVMDAYSSQGAVFALAKFDNKEAVRRGLVEGQGTVIHFTIPMKAPWIPLRILALGKNRVELVDADLFVLTDGRPTLGLNGSTLPGLTIKTSRPADDQLLQDLRSDQGMGWIPAHGMWLTAMTLHTLAGNIDADLSIDGGAPPAAPRGLPIDSNASWPLWVAIAIGVAGLIAALGLWMPARTPPRPA
jgi:Uncharacterized protein conserved in bacteria (DUF2330)